ncbi:MAG: VOC family protein [Anaerolineaceae bacterium]|nr:VOC family protein [Anaerolineaceae bacterium]
MQKIMPCLWFDHQAEEAANFYGSIFEDSKILEVARYGEGGPMPAGTVLTVTFTLQGQEFMALNGGPHFQFSPAISFYVNCESQEEVDRLWERLLDGGVEEQCGWLKDRYGVSWQIVPTVLGEMMNDSDPEKVKRVTAAMLKMVKLDIAGLKRAYAGD